MTLRTRLVVVALATLAVGLGALLVTGNVLLAARVDADTTSLLHARADAQLAALHVTRDRVAVRETPNDSALDREAWVLDGTRLIERPGGASPALDRAAVALGRRGHTAEADGPGDVRLRAEPAIAPGASRASGAVVVGLSVEPFERLRKEVLVGSLVLAGLVLLAGGLAIWSAVGGALHPVAQMTATAEDWGAHDLDRRFDLGPPRDELTGLAATLDGLLARIAASRRHEQRFAAEAAHELRTPLAGLRGRAELALEAAGDGADAERRDALRAVLADVTRLDETIDALLAMARQELDPTSGAVDLVALARETPEADVVAPPGGLPPAEGDPDIVRRALAPLVANARRHARARVWLELSSDGRRVRLAVRDDGPGLAPGTGDEIFEPGVRGPDAPADGGAGLGLPLARRLARSCGGDVTAERPANGAGGCFVLELPALGRPSA